MPHQCGRGAAIHRDFLLASREDANGQEERTTLQRIFSRHRPRQWSSHKRHSQQLFCLILNCPLYALTTGTRTGRASFSATRFFELVAADAGLLDWRPKHQSSSHLR